MGEGEKWEVGGVIEGWDVRGGPARDGVGVDSGARHVSR